MNEEVEEKSDATPFVWLWLVVLVMLLYVLSIGPVVRFTPMGNRGALRQFYSPVIWLHDNTFLRKPLEAYVQLWGIR
jgi:hypothetical protein